MWYFYVYFQSNALEILPYHFFYKKKLNLGQTAKMVTLCNLITHPVVIFFWMAVRMNYLHSILMAEAFAIIVEAVLHHKVARFSWKRSFSASIVANLISWQLGPLLTYALFYK